MADIRMGVQLFEREIKTNGEINEVLELRVKFII